MGCPCGRDCYRGAEHSPPVAVWAIPDAQPTPFQCGRNHTAGRSVDTLRPFWTVPEAQSRRLHEGGPACETALSIASPREGLAAVRTAGLEQSRFTDLPLVLLAML